MSYDLQIFLLALGLLIDIIITARTARELNKLKRMIKVFDKDDEDFGAGIE